MSTRVGTFQGHGWAPGTVPTAAFAIVVAIATVVVAGSMGSDRGADRSGQPAPATSEVSGTVANTPTEIRGGMREAVAGGAQAFVGNTAANTPSEMRDWTDAPTSWPRTADAVAASIAAERYDRHQRR